MHYLQQIECGLPAEDLVLAGVPCNQQSTGGVSEGRRRARFKPGSPWRANCDAGQRLSWRGRNFIEAFAAINHCDLVLATMFALVPGEIRVLPPHGSPGAQRQRYYHLVCGASPGGEMRLGDNLVALRAGDFWRVQGAQLPRIVRGGCEGGLHLEIVLALRHAPPRAGPMADQGEIFGGRENKSSAAA